MRCYILKHVSLSSAATLGVSIGSYENVDFLMDFVVIGNVLAQKFLNQMSRTDLWDRIQQEIVLNLMQTWDL